ncbi:MAG: alpha/beta fold hydrolase [Planctomycetota bacterium]
MRPALLSLLFAAFVSAEPVSFKTSDNVEIHGVFDRMGKDAATVICLPMFQHTNKSYAPLLDPLRRAGLNVLALDLRGHGLSAPQWRRRAERRERALFNTMYRDIGGAIEFLKSRGCDVTRIGLVGASVGCRVAIHSAVKFPDNVRVVVLLTPGSNYFDVTSMEHLKAWPGTRTLLATATEDQKKSQAVIDALTPFPGSQIKLVEGKDAQGTRMFQKVAGAKQSVADFLRDYLVEAPDVTVPEAPEGFDKRSPSKAEFARKLTRRVGDVTYQLRLFRKGDVWTLGVSVDGSFRGDVTLHIDSARIKLPFREVSGGAPPEPKIFGSSAPILGLRDSFGPGGGWVFMNLETSKWGSLLRKPKLAVVFQPGNGAAVRLPAKELAYYRPRVDR